MNSIFNLILSILYFFFSASILLAENSVFNCKPIYAAVQMENGHIYSETLDDMDEESGLLSAVPNSKLSIRSSGIFYKNNSLRNYEYLKTYKEITENNEISPKITNTIDEIEEISQELDLKLGVENYRVFYLPYYNHSHTGELINFSIKRISIDVNNNFTSEITIPGKSKENVNLYYFLRKCEGEGVQIDFEPAINKALS